MSVVVPVRNDPVGVRACVQALLAQTAPAQEILVVDNDSTDHTGQTARDAGARVIVEPRPGSYAARNAGISAATGDVVAFTDADCVPEPDWLARLLEPFARPRVGGVAGAVVAVETASAAQRWARERGLLDQAAAQRNRFLPFAATANVAYRRDTLAALGGFDPAMHSGGDVDLSWRMQAHLHLRLEFAPDAVVRHRQRTRVRELLQQQRRYGEGHALLHERWAGTPGYDETVGSFFQRTKAAWLLPLRLPWRLVARRSLSLAAIDAAVVVAREWGRARPRRLPQSN